MCLCRRPPCVHTWYTHMDPSEMVDHVTFSVSPFSSSTPVLSLAATLSPPLSDLTCPKLTVGKGENKKKIVCLVAVSPREKCKNVF